MGSQVCAFLAPKPTIPLLFTLRRFLRPHLQFVQSADSEKAGKGGADPIDLRHYKLRSDNLFADFCVSRAFLWCQAGGNEVVTQQKHVVRRTLRADRMERRRRDDKRANVRG